MSKTNWELVQGVLYNVRDALMTIEERFREVPDAAFFQSKEGWERRDGICMLFIAIGESFKKIDEQTDGTFLSRYSEIDRRKIIGLRNVIAHNYFDVDEDALFDHCQTHLPLLLATVKRMIEDLEKNQTNP